MADVFLDLWGVLTDSRKMTPAYRERAADFLRTRHGGPIEAWLRAHDVAAAWYEQHMARPETWDAGTWIEVVGRADSENILRMFREAGVPPPADPNGLSRALELEVMAGIDAAFPDARPAVARLKKAGHRLYVSTNATESNARGALSGAKLLTEFDTVFTGERQNAGKIDVTYWRGIVERLGTQPRLAGLPQYVEDAVRAERVRA
ncbi:MAG: HAD family hydrolase [Methanobacteriota archaeon]|nr:MAG: HAD family hydrolase [Euryarchaeota archaeon]